MLATHPVPTMRTRGLRKRTRSWIVSPASTWPPWELMNTVISSLDSPARASSCAVTPAATRWVISPLMITMRARNSRSAMRLYGGATDTSRGVNSSIGSPGLVANRRVRDLRRGPPALSQLRKRPRDVHPRHLLSPGQIEVGVVHRLRGAVRGVRGGRYALVRQIGSHERGAGLGDLLRPARHAAEDNARLYDSSPLPAPRFLLPLDPCRDAQHREVERSAAAQLVVHRVPAIGGREPHCGEDLVRLLRKVIHAVVVIEPRRRHDALAAGADQHVVRAQRHHHSRHVGRADGPAPWRRGRDPADVPVLLHAEVDRFAPLVRLIVVIAARVEAEIAAQRPHVAEQGGGDERGRASDDFGGLSDGLTVRQFGERHAGSEEASRIPHLASRELWNPHQRDDGPRLLVAALHVRIEIRAPGHVHPIGTRVRLHRERFLQRLGLQVGEGREPEHQRPAAFAARCRPLPPLALPAARPSPPSHGVATRVGSGQGKSGNPAGPNLPASPFSFRRSALNTFSGVMGTSSMRTPTASYTAFATAGGTGSSGPWPHSLAPNGPFGSGSSTT